MTTVFEHATIYTGTRVIRDGYLRFGEKVENVGPVADYFPRANEKVVDMRGKLLLPGFIDVHTHGGYSFDTMDGDAEELDKMVRTVAHEEGVTTIFPTTMTQSKEKIDKAMASINEAAQHNRLIGGTHLEGPFVSPVYKGAQPEQYIIKPDPDLLDHWDKLSGGRVKMITYAPENADAKFENYCLSHGIVLSAGHSNATRAEMKASKASHVTHLYNAQREFRHREPGVTGHALLEDNIICEIISDGFHVCPDMINLAYKLKGPHRIELVTDSLRAKGMPEGISELGGQKVIVKDKQARLENGHLAASIVQYNDAVKNIVKFTGCSINDAVQMSSVNQAREFHLAGKGSLEEGADADINVMTPELDLLQTYSYGQLMEAVK
ncbi:N-acetylglucosamine-6-phosphate deacetylase [Limosilactobacillus difficilis]|uniref:N-acetylglucosamine-6-phosphate deacetylase n=1 Tax=Limosilactobacillus difficilis TaxID=2991838 RepID=UPI0024BB1FEA|nr:N-acetylglucosamine-6-phosphate deacetylase [Limosilactobacillus difficilis]